MIYPKEFKAVQGIEIDKDRRKSPTESASTGRVPREMLATERDGVPLGVLESLGR